MATTRRDLRQRIGQSGFLDTVSTSTATSGSTSTLVDTARKNPDNAFNNFFLYITSGTAENDERTVSTWTQSSSTFVPTVNFSQAISTNTYELHRLFSPTRINQALNEAIRLSKSRWPIRTEDTSLTTAANKYGYALAAVAIDEDWGIDKVEVDIGLSGTTPPFVEIDRDLWYIRNVASTLTLQFKEICFPTDTKTLRLTYRKRPAAFTADTSTGGTLAPDTVPFQDFLCAQATALLARDQAIAEGEGDTGNWMQLHKRMNKWADEILSSDKPRMPPTEILMPSWDRDRGSGQNWEDDVSTIHVR